MVHCIFSRPASLPSRRYLLPLYLTGVFLLLCSCSLVKNIIFASPTPTLTQTPTLTFTPTQTSTPTPTPTSSPSPTPSPSPLPSLTPTQPPTGTPTPLSGPALLLAQANAKNKALKSVKVSLSIDIRSGDLKLQVKGTILQEKPAKSYTKVNNAGVQVEVYALDENTFYQRRSGEEWTRLGPAQLAQVQEIQGAGEMQLLELARNILQVQDGVVSGVACRHLLFELDMPAYLALYQPQYQQMVDADTTNGVGEVWIGKADGYIYRVLNRIDLGMQGGQVTTVTDLRLGSFNRPLAFPPTPNVP